MGGCTMTTVSQPGLAPTRKVSAAGAGVVLAPVIAYGLTMAGVPITPEITAALGSLLSFAAAYLVKEKQLD